jgi:hypothetical protein
MAAPTSSVFPRALTDYPDLTSETLLHALAERVRLEPFNGVATAVFVFAILHTFAAPRFTALAHRVQVRHDARALGAGQELRPSLAAEVLHFFGEVEVVFGLWAVVLGLAMMAYAGWDTVTHYLNDTVDYTEALFVVVIMAIASTRPIIVFARSTLRRIASAGGGTPAAWWLTILIVGPILGSFITEPGAMTICALLLARQFFDLEPSARLKYATLGLLFVNISVGGTLTAFAAPPVLMVATPWGWDTWYMLTHFGGKAVATILVSTVVYYIAFRRDLRELASRSPAIDVEHADDAASGAGLVAVPAWLIATHVLFMMWTVFNAHYPALFISGFLFFLGVTRATAAYQERLELRTPLLVGFFLAGLVIHGRLQGWWLEPVLRSLSETPLFLSATLLTAFNDNALITYLATLVPNLDPGLKMAVVQGAVTGGGLTVIANAPNPAGQALVRPFFQDAVSPLKLAAGALVATLIAAAAFRLM